MIMLTNICQSIPHVPLNNKKEHLIHTILQSCKYNFV